MHGDADRLRVPEARFQVPILAIVVAARLKIHGNVRRDLLTDDNGFHSTVCHFISLFLCWVLMRGTT